jgi:hypothetical protein
MHAPSADERRLAVQAMAGINGSTAKLLASAIEQAFCTGITNRSLYCKYLR